MNPRVLALLFMLFVLKSTGQVCLSGILIPSGAGCGCLAGCNLGPYGGPNCGSGVTGDCTGGYQLLTFSIPVPADCELKVSAIMQPLPGCTASGGDANPGAGDRLKVEGSIAKPFQVGSGNNTLSDDVTQQGGTITITAYANRADELVQYTVEYVSGNCPICNLFLPIELLNFDVQWMDGTLLFDWTTATETNNAFFAIEQSDDLKIWTEVLRKPGAGTTTEAHKYSATTPYSKGGVHYFRLRQIDFNGSNTTGPIAAVLIPQTATPYLTHDKNNNNLQVVIPTGNAEQYIASVYTMDGRIITNIHGTTDDQYSISLNSHQGLAVVVVRSLRGEVVLQEKVWVE